MMKLSIERLRSLIAEAIDTSMYKTMSSGQQTHLVRAEDDQQALCNRVKHGTLEQTNEGDQRPTCPTCAKMWDKLHPGKLSEMSTSQAKVAKPLNDFIEHLNLAKKDLSVLYQQTTDKKGSDHAMLLLNTINKMIKSLDRMPELTRDPWQHVRRGDS